MKETISERDAPLVDFEAAGLEDLEDLEDVAAEADPVATLEGADFEIVRAEIVVPETVCSGMTAPSIVVAATVVGCTVIAAIVVGAVAVTESPLPTLFCGMMLPTPDAV